MFTRGLILLCLLAVLGTFCYRWYSDRFLNQLREATDATAAILPLRLSMEGDLRLMKKRWHDFAVAKPGDEAVFDLTEDDLRTLLRSKTLLGERAEVRLVNEQAIVGLTLPLDHVPFLGDRLQGRFLNLSATMTPVLEDGIARVKISKASSGGKILPDDPRNLLELAASAWLYNALLPQREVIARVKQVRIDNRAMYLRQ